MVEMWLLTFIANGPGQELFVPVAASSTVGDTQPKVPQEGAECSTGTLEARSSSQNEESRDHGPGFGDTPLNVASQRLFRLGELGSGSIRSQDDQPPTQM